MLFLVGNPYPLFARGKTRVVAERVQLSIECKDARLADALEAMLRGAASCSEGEVRSERDCAKRKAAPTKAAPKKTTAPKKTEPKKRK